MRKCINRKVKAQPGIQWPGMVLLFLLSLPPHLFAQPHSLIQLEQHTIEKHRFFSVGIKIINSPPFWGTLWFKISLSILFIVTIVILHKRRTHFIIKRKDEIEQMDKIISSARLGAMIAHEISNPLFAISNGVKILKKKLNGSRGDVTEVIEIMENEINRLKKIPANHGDFVMEQSQCFEVSEINKILSAAIRVLKWGRKTKNTQILLKTKFEKFIILCNPNSLQQVFINIIENSIESMNGKGNVTIDIISQNGFHEIHFTDSGPGFSKSLKSKLFEPLDSLKNENMGLGLFISYNIIKDHRGEIILDEDYSKGAHIIIKLPRKGDTSIG